MATDDRVKCPACGQQIPKDSNPCPECHEATDSRQQLDQAYSSPANDGVNTATFGLGSMLLVTTLIGATLGLFMIEPGLGVISIVLTTPALVRTIIRIQKGKQQGESLDPGRKFVAFMGSLGIMVATAIAVGIAFFATCWGGFFAGMAIGVEAGQKNYDPLGTGLVVGLTAGGLAGLTCAVFVIRWWWPIRIE